MSQGARARIDTSALAHNLRQIRRAAPSSAVMAVIKADAYGHGMVRVARALAGADALAVAHVEEALALRGAGVADPIVVLEGPSVPDELAAAHAAGLELVIHCLEQLEMLSAWRRPGDFTIWMKIDTGMNRLGFRMDEAGAALRRLRECLAVRAPVRFMTHLASADRPEDPATDAQLEAFTKLLQSEHAPIRSIANSAAVLSRPASHAEWIRPGIVLYGASPFAERSAEALGLRPAMTLQTRLIATKRVRAGETVGYGRDWQAETETRIGVAAIGYGDGYPRHAGNGTPVLVNGKRVPLVGRVSMDMISVDLAAVPEARVGDPVVLWGTGLPVEEVAARAGTIAYELLAGVTRRVRREG